MRKIFNDLAAIFLILILVSYWGHDKVKHRGFRWSYVLVAIAVILLIVRVIWVAAKG